MALRPESNQSPNAIWVSLGESGSVGRSVRAGAGDVERRGLITLERVTLDGTKIKANASGNTFRRKEKLQAHLELAREQVRMLNAEGEQEKSTTKRQTAARRRAARQRASRLEAAVREVERLQEEKKHDRKEFMARSSSTDPDAM